MVKRRIDSLRRIGLPKDALREMGWSEGDEILIVPHPREGVLCLTRERSTCLCCGGVEELVPVREGLSLCRFCLSRLR